MGSKDTKMWSSAIISQKWVDEGIYTVLYAWIEDYLAITATRDTRKKPDTRQYIWLLKQFAAGLKKKKKHSKQKTTFKTLHAC